MFSMLPVIQLPLLTFLCTIRPPDRHRYFLHFPCSGKKPGAPTPDRKINEPYLAGWTWNEYGAQHIITQHNITNAHKVPVGIHGTRNIMWWVNSWPSLDWPGGPNKNQVNCLSSDYICMERHSEELKIPTTYLSSEWLNRYSCWLQLSNLFEILILKLFACFDFGVECGIFGARQNISKKAP